MSGERSIVDGGEPLLGGDLAVSLRVARLLAISILSTVVGIGCTTTKIVSDPHEVSVPAGLTKSQVEWAILSAVANRPLTPEQIATASVGPSRADWVHTFKGEWATEAIEDGLITAGLSVRSHYLQVAIHYDTTYVWSEITRSRNLNQSGTSIHKKAIAWNDRLVDRIRAELGRLALASHNFNNTR